MNKSYYLACALSLIAATSHAQESPISIATKTGNTLGLTLSGYQYKEPSLDVIISAPLIGLDYMGIYAFGNDWFVKADARYAYGSASYSGSGTQNNIPYSYYDLRGLFGYDLRFSELGGFVIAPFTGIGYRYLFDNQGGQTSTGANAYNRSSTYVYLPIGVTHRMKINEGHKLETIFEYDYLIQGTQVSYLSQAASFLPDITNQQFRGYGLRFSSMYQFDTWSVGPYLTYWNIQDSNIATQTITVNQVNYRLSAYEPANSTLEAGIKLAFTF